MLYGTFVMATVGAAIASLALCKIRTGPSISTFVPSLPKTLFACIYFYECEYNMIGSPHSHPKLTNWLLPSGKEFGSLKAVDISGLMCAYLCAGIGGWSFFQWNLLPNVLAPGPQSLKYLVRRNFRLAKIRLLS